jgi:RimJ/RimL family protein N-acetyltransferase
MGRSSDDRGSMLGRIERNRRERAARTAPSAQTARQPAAIKPETIPTNRLVLLPLRVAHAEEMAAALADPQLHTFIGGAPADPAALRARYERLVTGSPDPTISWCNWVIRLRDQACLVGTVQATVTDAAHERTAEVAWVVGTLWQGQGIATEATRGLRTWLAQHAVHIVTAHIHPDHRASAAVATAAGLTPTSVWHDGEVKWVGSSGT